MILSNQVECTKCGDKPFSSHRHDFQYCKCGAVAVDGGMDYLKRTGSSNNYKEMSVSMDDDLYKACDINVKEMVNSGRNALGIICGIVRTLRDNGYDITANPTFSHCKHKHTMGAKGYNFTVCQICNEKIPNEEGILN